MGCSYPGWPFLLRLCWSNLGSFWQAEVYKGTYELARELLARDAVQIDRDAPHGYNKQALG